jgi:hypothetical protein
MSSDDNPRQELLLKNWELVQDIIKTLGDRSWQVKAWGVTVWWAVLGYAVSADKPLLLWYLLVFIGIVLSIDITVRLTEEKFFEHTKAIEGALTAIAVGDTQSRAAQPIGTSVSRPQLRDLPNLFSFRRVGFWFPYLALTVTTAFALSAAGTTCS